MHGHNFEADINFFLIKSFLLQVWNDSWEYTPNTTPCMLMWFNATEENPNDLVARLKVEDESKRPQHINKAVVHQVQWMLLFLIVAILF